MYIGEIIKDYRIKNNISQRAFAERTSLSPSYINTLEKVYNPKNGKPYSVTIEVATELSKAMFMSIQDLLFLINNDQAFIINSTNTNLKIDKPENPVVKIPILGTVKAGYDWLAEENVIGYITDKDTVKDYEKNINEYFALQVIGDSMLPLLSEGDLVIVHDQEDVESGQTAVVLINGEEATVKKVVKTNDGIELHAMNPYYPIKKFTFEDMKKIPVKIIGRVKEAKIKGAFE